MQANLATKLAAIDTEITQDTMVLRVPAAANYYRGSHTAGVALSDTLPAIVLSFQGTTPDAARRSEKLGSHAWELQYIDQHVGVAGFTSPQQELEERVSRAAVGIWQVFMDNQTLTVSSVAYARAWQLERIVPTDPVGLDELWVRGISLFFHCPFGWS